MSKGKAVTRAIDFQYLNSFMRCLLKDIMWIFGWLCVSRVNDHTIRRRRTHTAPRWGGFWVRLVGARQLGKAISCRKTFSPIASPLTRPSTGQAGGEKVLEKGKGKTHLRDPYRLLCVLKSYRELWLVNKGFMRSKGKRPLATINGMSLNG